jgi:hypothetical protein
LLCSQTTMSKYPRSAAAKDLFHIRHDLIKTAAVQLAGQPYGVLYTDSQTTHKISVPHMLNCPDLCSSSLQGSQQQNIRFENTPCSSWTASQLCMYCLIYHGKYRVWVQNNLNLRILDTRCPWASANNTLGVQELQGIAQQSANSLTLIVLSLARSVWPLELSGGFSHWVVFVENFATPISPFRKAKQLCCRKERIWTVKRILGRQMLSDN